jgi:hypothetical protein
VPVAPVAACAVVESTRVSHHGRTGDHPAFPHAMVLTAYSALSLVTGLVCHHRRRNLFRQLDASVGASGPHDFAVRKIALSSLAQLASIASRPYVRDDRETPLCVGRDDERYAGDLGQKGTGIFLQGGLDRQSTDLPVGHREPPVTRWPAAPAQAANLIAVDGSGTLGFSGHAAPPIPPSSSSAMSSADGVYGLNIYIPRETA